MSAADKVRRGILASSIRAGINGAVHPDVITMAEVIRRRHGKGVAAVLAYGSCLRGVATNETLIDLYVLTDSYREVSTKPLLRAACRLVPPNVYYVEAETGRGRLRAKYAVLPLSRFAKLMRPSVRNPYFWARFAQPCRLVAVRDTTTARAVEDALVTATATFFSKLNEQARPGDDWREAMLATLAATYATEFRPERADRALSILLANESYYQAAAELVLGNGWRATEAGRKSWFWRRLAGRALSVLRLIKAAFTFEGGADYLAWKISRHSGVEMRLTPWQRRHPVLGALTLLPGLLLRGAVR